MLIDFTVENFRSFDHEQTFSMVASSNDELPDNRFTTPTIDHPLLRSAVIYGANASGKSNLLMAMHTLGRLAASADKITEQADSSSGMAFALRNHRADEPSVFSVRFIAEGTRYGYRVALQQSQIVEEQLLAYPGGQKQIWFSRQVGQPLRISADVPSLNLPSTDASAEYRTYLSVATANGHPALTTISRWLQDNLWLQREAHSNHGITTTDDTLSTVLCVEDESFRLWVGDILRRADIGIREVQIELDPTTGRQSPYFIHAGSDGKTVRLSIEQESRGTQRIFSMLSRIYSVLQSGGVALFDEFDTSFHPLLSRELIRIFNSAERNHHNAQLIFTTHDTTLMSAKLFRRDQIWLAEKNPQGATELFSLADIQNVRPDEAIEEGYLRGRYGAIPWLGQFEFPEKTETTETAADSDPHPAP